MEKEKSRTKVLRAKKKSISTNIQSNDENVFDEKPNPNDELVESNKENIQIKSINMESISNRIKKKIELKLPVEEEGVETESDEENNTNVEKQTVFVNNIPPKLTDDELHNFILKQNKKIKILECRVVKDKAGKSRGFAFIDFKDVDHAKKCVQVLNKQVINEYEVSCALSKPPSSG